MTALAVRGRTSGGLLSRAARRILFSRLDRLRRGLLHVREGDRRWTFGRPATDDPLEALLEVHDPAFYTRSVLGGSIGAAEAYMDGHWSCEDLTALVRVLARNRDLNQGLEKGLARLRAPLDRWIHLRRANTPGGSRRNIMSHYDLGNEFFSCFLDPTMMYSCAVFPRLDASLEEASRHKLELVCRKLGLAAEHRVLEIGSGWGGFALHAAAHHGCRVVTTTVSQRQYEHCVERVRAAGLEDRVTVLDADYRDLPQRLGRRFDRLVSIEMIEAVGHRYFERYFDVCGRLLEPDGLMLLQGILIPDGEFERYRRSVDFIQKYIFPGGCLPSLAALQRAVARATDLRLVHLEDLTRHYPLTLRHWRRRFGEAGGRIRDLGFPEAFQRMWEFYLCYCEGGFLERTVGVAQMMWAGSGNRDGSCLTGGGGSWSG
jgi:cyclopropane-fatty-acyl-phospholipid synthase